MKNRKTVSDDPARSDGSMSSNHDCFELKIPPRLDYLSTVRGFVDSLSRDAGFEDPDVEKIVMSVDEAISNSITYNRSNEDPLSITIEVTPKELIIRILDAGDNFGLEFLSEIELEDHLEQMRQNGLGLHIMKSFMDTVEYQRTPSDMNLLILTKVLKV